VRPRCSRLRCAVSNMGSQGEPTFYGLSSGCAVRAANAAGKLTEKPLSRADSTLQAPPVGLPVDFLKDQHFGDPIGDFLNELPLKQRAKAIRTIGFVEDLEHAHSGYLKKLVSTEDIWELRVSFAGDIQRYLGIIHGGRLILVHAFIKKTQKTPSKEIAVAETRARMYLQRRTQK